MKNLTKLVNRTKNAIGIGLAGAILCGATSCATMTQAQKTSLWGDIITVAGGLNVAGTKTKTDRFLNDAMVISGGIVSKQGQMQHDLEVAGAGRDQIVINTNQPSYQNKNEEEPVYLNNSENTNTTPEGFFMYKNFVDFNGDGAAERDEYLGLNESVYDLRNLDRLWFSFYGGGKRDYDGQNLNLKIYSMDDGKIINYFNEQYTGGVKIQNFICESKYFPKGGKYKAVLNTNNGKSFSLDFNIIK
jgi:hypothetical protein